MRLLPFLAALLTLSCAIARRGGAPFRVLPGDPSYLLRSPDAIVTPFPEIPARFTPTAQAWVDLRPQMGIRVENAYFREGSGKHTVDEFIGTEVAEYGVANNGSLHLASLQSKFSQHPVPQQPGPQHPGPQHPQDQPPVQALLPDRLARYRFHRYFYQVVFDRAKGKVSGAVLLGASSAAELSMLGARLLTDPDSVCGGRLAHCAVFPELCSVSVQMEIVVNGAPRRVLWGSQLGSVAVRPRTVQLLRTYLGRLTPVEIDVQDANALRLPLLPGDSLTWEPRGEPQARPNQ